MTGELLFIRLDQYQFIEQHHHEYGVRWLLRRFKLCPNDYYNYLKHRKANHQASWEKTPKKPHYVKGEHYKKFANLLGQKFEAERPNQKWCTDFTYLYLNEGEKRYNCSVIDLYDKSVIAIKTAAA